MSRSNPTQNAQNPSNRFYEWNGEEGVLRYFDKAKKENVNAPAKFIFIVLDELSTIRGWHERSKSGIFANEVRDTTTDPFVVKAFKGGVLAEGLYRAIKDRTYSAGGKFTANVYIAYREGKGPLQIGALQLHGASLNAWVEFRKANRKALYEKAVKIDGFKKGKKGKIEFKVPVFAITEVSEETNESAKTLDNEELQPYLLAYLSKRVSERADASVQDDAPADNQEAPPDDDSPPPSDDEPETPPEGDDVPF